MRVIKAKIKGFAEYTQTRYVDEEKLKKESYDQYEQRIWKKRLHLNEKGEVVIPAQAVKKAIAQAARLNGEKVAGKGMKTWGPLFKSGVLCTKDATTGVKEGKVVGKVLFLDATGKPGGGGGRVKRIYPTLDPGWEAEVELIIANDEIHTDKVVEYLKLAGQCVGIGQFRPENGGSSGLFTVVSTKEETRAL